MISKLQNVNIPHAKIVRYLIAGSFSFILESSLFFVLYNIAELNIFVANSISYSVALITSFTLNRFWVFKAKHNIYSQGLQYIILALVNLPLTNILLGVIKIFIESALLAKILVMVVIVIWNFTIFNKFIFKQKNL